MVNTFGKSIKDVADMIGIKATDIENMILSYETMNRGNIADLDRFSFFVEYFKNRELKKQRDEDTTFTDKFISWVKEERIPRAERVRDLPNILKDKKARREFVEDGEDFDYCVEVASKRHPERADSFYRNLKKTTGVLRNAPAQRIKEDIENNKSKKDIVRRLAREVKRFCRNLNLDQD